MKQLNQYIIEKFKINSNNIYKDGLTKENKDKIFNELSKYFQAGGSYNGNDYENRLEIVTKHFDKDIYKFIDSYNIWDDLAEWLDIDDENKFRDYIDYNREELYNDIKADIDDIIQ